MNQTMSVIKKRFPDLFRKLESVEPMPCSWSNGPKPTLVFHNTSPAGQCPVHLTSQVKPKSEAITQSTLLPNDAKSAWLYGTGLGELQRHVLKRPTIKAATVIMNMRVAKSVFLASFQADWLAHPRSHLVDGSEITTSYGPFAVSPMDLYLADKSCWALRDRLNAILNSKFNEELALSRATEQLHNIDENRRRFSDSVVYNPVTAPDERPTFVIGAGPTLVKYLPLIKNCQPRVRVVAVSTALRSLASAGIIPDVVISIDFSSTVVSHFADIDMQYLKNTLLVYDPVVNPGVIANWTGPRVCAVTGPNHALWAAGSVIHSCVDFSVKSGTKEITLIGADFCYVAGMSHAKMAPELEDMSIHKWLPTVVDGLGREVQSANALCQFARYLEDYIGKHPEVRFTKLGKEGVPLKGAAWIDGD